MLLPVQYHERNVSERSEQHGTSKTHLGSDRCAMKQAP